MATVVAFIDARVGDPAAIVDRLPPDTDWYVLAADDDGIGQMRRILAGYSDLAAIHVVSHGGEGVLYLGSTTLDAGGLTAHTAALADIGAALSEDGDLLLYGCNIGRGAGGAAFVDALAGATGADVAASSDATGATALGGNWALEVAAGPIEAAALSGGDFAALLDSSVSIAPLQAFKPEGIPTWYTFAVTRIGNLSNQAESSWAVTGGGAHPADAADFGGTLPSGTVTFGIGETNKVVAVLATDDAAVEFDEGFTITLSNPSPGLIILNGSASGAIQNDDKSTVSIAPLSADKAEGNGGTTPFTFTVSLDQAGVAEQTVGWTVAGSGAHPADAADFGGSLPSGTVTLAAGETSQVVTVLASGDTAVEFDEGFTVTLSGPSAGLTIGTSSAAAIIDNDDTPSISIAALSADKAEGDVGTISFTFTVSLDQPSVGDQTVDWSVAGSGVHSADGLDFGGALPSGTVTFVAGETVKLLSVPVTGDIWTESDENFFVILSNASAGLVLGTVSATGTIVTDDFPPRLTIAAQSADKAEGDVGTTPLTFMVSLDRPDVADRTVDWSVTGSGAHPADEVDFGGALPSGTVTFMAGETDKLVTVQVWRDIFTEFDEKFSVNLSNPSAGLVIETASAFGTILNDDFPVISIGGGIAIANEGSPQSDTDPLFVWDVSLDRTPVVGYSVQWAVTGSGKDRAAVDDFPGSMLPSGILTFAPGEVSKSISFAASRDSTVEPDETFTIQLINPSSGLKIGTATAQGTIVNDDVSVVSLGGGDRVVIEGSSWQTDNTPYLVWDVVLDQPPVAAQSVQWGVTGSGTNPASAADFVGGQLPAGILTFAPGEISKTISFAVLPDSTVEPDETFAIELSNPSSGLAIGVGSAIVVVNGDDANVGMTVFSLAHAEGQDGATAFAFGLARTALSLRDDIKDQGIPSTFTVAWSVEGKGSDPATASDFVGGVLPSGTVTMTADETTATITVLVAGDTSNEADESFVVVLSNPSPGLTIDVGTAAGTIINDDDMAGPPILQIAASGQGIIDGTGAVNAGKMVLFTVTMGEPVTVTGSPVLRLNNGAFAVYQDDSGFGFTSGPGWVYTVQPGQDTADLRVASLDLAGGAIRNAAGVDAVLSGAMGYDPQGTLVVDTTAPTIVSITTSGEGITDGTGIVGVGDTVLFTVTTSEPVTLTGAPVLELGNGGIGALHDQKVYETYYTYVVLPGQDTSDLTVSAVSLASLGAAVRDAAGNDANLSGAVAYDPQGTLAVATQARASLSGSMVERLEGDGGTTSFEFEVALSGDLSSARSVSWSVTGAGGSPAGASDFGGGSLPSGTLTFAIGETSRTIVVKVAGDTAVEPDQGFTVTLSNPSPGLALGTASAGGTIRNDDWKVMSSWAEDVGDSVILARAVDPDNLSGGWSATGEFTIIAGNDDGLFEIDATGGISLAAGKAFDYETSQRHVLTAGLIDHDGNSVLGPVLVTINIVDAIDVDEPFLALAPAAIEDLARAEGNVGTTAFHYIVTLSGDVDFLPPIVWSVTGSGDHAATASDFAGGVLPGDTVTFAPGETSKTITVEVMGDSLVEFDETFKVTLSNPSSGLTLGTASAEGTILDDDATLSIAVTDATKSEGNSGTTAFTFTVTVTTDLGDTATHEVGWWMTGIGPHPADGSDFADGVLPTGTLTFAAGETSKTITVQVAGDTLVEADETFAVMINHDYSGDMQIGGYAAATGTILNDDATVSIAATDAIKAEGNSGTTSFTFTVTVTTDLGDTSTHEVGYWMTGIGPRPADGSDFAGGVLPTGTLTFAAGEISKTVTVGVIGDGLVEADEGFVVTLSNPSPGLVIGTASAAGTIVNDDTSISITAIDAVRPEGDTGTTALTFAVTRAGNVSGGQKYEYGHDSLYPLAGAPGGDAIAAHNSDPADYFGSVLPSGTVAFAPGETSKTVTVSVAGDGIVEFDESLSIIVFDPSVGPSIDSPSATGTILNDDKSKVSIAAVGLGTCLDPDSDGFTDTCYMTIALDQSPVSAQTVQWSTAGSGPTPASASDFVGGVLPSGTVTFAPGETIKTVGLVVSPDTLVEPDEDFTVSLSGLSSGLVLGTGSAVGTIVNNDVRAYDDAYVVHQGQPLTVAQSAGVLANDLGVSKAVLLASPAHGTVQLAADGSFVYAPATGFFGVDTFSYRVRIDDLDLDLESQLCTIHVVPVSIGATTTLDLLALSAEEQIASTYAAFFGRAADAAGFAFWVDQFVIGLPVQGAATLFANIASSFGISDEARALYPFLASPFGASDSQVSAFLESVYENLFDRSSDAGGLAYWTGQVQQTLAAGQFVGSVLINIMSGAQDTAAGKDITTLMGKVAVSLAYVHEQQDHHTVWAGASDIAAATTLLEAVTADPQTVLVGVRDAEALIAAHG